MAWGLITNFDDRIKDIVSAYTGDAGGISGVDSNAVQQWLIDGCYDVIEKIKVTDTGAIEEFVIRSSSWADGTPQDLDEVREVTSVERNEYPARSINFALRKRVTDSDSIHYATEKDPAFFIGPATDASAGRKLTLKPDAGAGEVGYYYYIPDYTITSWDNSTSSIDNFPKKYYDHVILYGAIRILERNYIDLVNQEEDLELATSHSNHLNLLRQDYQTALQIVTAGLTQGQVEKTKE